MPLSALARPAVAVPLALGGIAVPLVLLGPASSAAPAAAPAAAAVSAAAPTPAVTTTRQLSAEAAMRAALVALRRCTRDGYRVSVAVVDRTGLERATLRGDGAGPHTYESAVRKAYTAASFGALTSALQERVADPAASTLRDIPGVLFLGGGVPVMVGDETIAGVGVAGAPGGQFDEACAKSGIGAIRRLLD